MGIIEIKNITKRFNDKLVLDNVSFKVNEGEIFGFIGPNGAGKSTLINIMTTLLVPDSGKIKICGYDIVKESLKAKANIGYVPQDIALLEELSAYDNLEFFGALYGLKGKLLKERIKEALEVTGLEDKRKQKVKKFSGGMKRRLNIATAIMHHPKVLIMDEPTVGVDPQSRNHIFTFTKKICKEWGTTVIYTSHYMEEVEELCERVFIIDLGKEIAYGNKEDIKRKVKKFSGGMKRRLNIATAIMHHPKVLIMDEPTVGVDPQSRNHIFTFTKKICKEWGTTVIYTSHYMEEVEELCERVFIIDLGKEIAYGNKEDIKSSVFPNNKVIINASNISGEALLKLENVEGVLKVLDNENLITLTINSNFKLGNALNILEKENVVIKKISYEEAKLEDVFLTLTGKNLRD